MTAFRRNLATVALALLWAGCSYDPAELSRLEAAIINGTIDTGHPAVGVQTVKSEVWCTASLIGKRTVLTAAHCVVDQEKPPYTLNPQQGFSIDGVATPIPAASVVYHPGYDGVEIENDVAVIRLSQDVPGITPVQLATTTPAVGETIEIVGYGVTSEYAEDYGTKRTTQNTIGKVTTTQYVFYGASGAVGSHCYGDSGGPSFVMRNGKQLQVGIHSWGEDVCGVAEHDVRVDAFHGWIQQQAQGDLSDGNTNAAPGVTIVSPAPGATVASAFQVDVSTQDDVGVARVELTVDGQLVDSRQQPQASCQLQVSGLSAGSHSLSVEATDAAGLRGSAQVTVTVQAAAGPDTQPPPPSTPSSPAAPSTTGPNTVEVTGACALVPPGLPGAAAWVLLLPLLLLALRRGPGG